MDSLTNSNLAPQNQIENQFRFPDSNIKNNFWKSEHHENQNVNKKVEPTAIADYNFYEESGIFLIDYKSLVSLILPEFTIGVIAISFLIQAILFGLAINILPYIISRKKYL